MGLRATREPAVPLGGNVVDGDQVVVAIADVVHAVVGALRVGDQVDCSGSVVVAQGAAVARGALADVGLIQFMGCGNPVAGVQLDSNRGSCCELPIWRDTVAQDDDLEVFTSGPINHNPVHPIRIKKSYSPLPAVTLSKQIEFLNKLARSYSSKPSSLFRIELPSQPTSESHFIS